MKVLSEDIQYHIALSELNEACKNAVKYLSNTFALSHFEKLNDMKNMSIDLINEYLEYERKIENE